MNLIRSKLGNRAGLGLALTTALISGLSIYLNKFAVQAVSDPVLFTTLKNSLVGLALGIGLLVIGRERPSQPLSLRHWVGLGGLALFGGSLPFLLFFTGLASAAAPSAALIHKSLFLWVALLAAPVLGERLGRWTLIGLGTLTLGQVLIGWPKAWGWGQGESLILIATLLWAVETLLARKLLSAIPVSVAATARMLGGALAMWLYLLATGHGQMITTLSVVQWGWIGLTSALLLGYVLTWYAALQQAPATLVTSVLTLGAVITAGLSLTLEGTSLATPQVFGLGLVIVGVYCVIKWRSLWRPNAGIVPA